MAATSSARWFCYLLACADGSLYTGITTALDRRLTAHNAGSASKYTRARRPVRLVWVESCPDRATASRREAAVKALPRALKLALAEARPATPPLPREAAGAPPPRARPGRTGAGGAAPARPAAAPSPARAARRPPRRGRPGDAAARPQPPDQDRRATSATPA
jgi:putative endonuclease